MTVNDILKEREDIYFCLSRGARIELWEMKERVMIVVAHWTIIELDILELKVEAHINMITGCSVCSYTSSPCFYSAKKQMGHRRRLQLNQDTPSHFECDPVLS